MSTRSETLPKTMPRTVPETRNDISASGQDAVDREKEPVHKEAKGEGRFQELADFSKDPQNTKLSKGEYSL